MNSCIFIGLVLHRRAGTDKKVFGPIAGPYSGNNNQLDRKKIGSTEGGTVGEKTGRGFSPSKEEARSKANS